MREEKYFLTTAKMTKDFAIVTGLARVCEYVYRKGVAEAASFGDVDAVLSIADREDDNTTFCFLGDEEGEQISQLHYQDYIVVYCSKANALHLRNFLIYERGRNMMKKNICTLVDYVYRTGLRDGIKYDKHTALDYFADVKNGYNHGRLDKTKPSTITWIQEIKYYADKVHNKRRRSKIASTMNQLSIYIGESVLNHKYEQE